VASKYYGPDPHQIPIDNGNYHGGTQDLRIGLQYKLTPVVDHFVDVFTAMSASARRKSAAAQQARWEKAKRGKKRS